MVENTKTSRIYDVSANRVQTNSNVQINNLVIKDALEINSVLQSSWTIFADYTTSYTILSAFNFWRLQKHKKQLKNFKFGPYQLNIPISNSIR